jgi:hypothetical protein
MTAPEPASARYNIRIRGHLDSAWSTWFDGMSITPEADGTTALVGPIPDQAALYGLLARLRDLGATLLAVERIATEGPSASGQQPRPHDDYTE